MPTHLWNLVGRVLAKIQKHQNVQIMLVAPVWPSQPWYPTLLGLLTDHPRLLPQVPDLIVETGVGTLPEMVLSLAVWPISSSAIWQKKFQSQLQDSCWCLGGKSRQNHMTTCSKNVSAGVKNGISIPFLDL